MDDLEQHLPLVERLAKHIARRLPDAVQLDDLLGAGALALVEASKTYKATNDASFETYVAYRIKGAMIDELRSHTWLPRRVSREMRSINDAQWRLEQRLGREPTRLELAKESGLDVHRALNDFHQAEMPLDVAREDELITFTDDPANKLADLQIITAIIEAIDTLNDRERRLIYMMYDEGLEQQVVAQAMNISASRICQIHKRTLQKLRKRLAA